MKDDQVAGSSISMRKNIAILKIFDLICVGVIIDMEFCSEIRMKCPSRKNKLEKV